MLVFCPNCYAEIFDLSENCLFCGGELQRQQETQSELSLELAGFPVVWQLGEPLIRGTLLQGRFSVLQFKDQINGGDYYIALDQALADYCFVVFWETENEDWLYHQKIQNVSSIKEVGGEHFYSVFSSQEGLPLQEALQRLGWNRQRVWEILRQVCALLSPVHDDDAFVGYIDPSNLWVQNDGQLIFSTQRHSSLLSDSWEEDVRAVIRLLFWLIDPQKEIVWSSVPFKLRKSLQNCWKTPLRAEQLWWAVDHIIRERGWFHLSIDSGKLLLNHHSPNVVLLNGDELAIPDTIQLCFWNSVTGTWRLKGGFLLLETNFMALYEGGFVENDGQVSEIRWMEEIAAGTVPEIENKALLASLLLHYGDQNLGHQLLAASMRETKSSQDWLMMARVLCVEGDRKGVERAVSLAEHWAKTLEEHLNVIALIRWEEGDVFWAKKKLQALKGDSWKDNLLLSEAWYALFFAEDQAIAFEMKAWQCSMDGVDRDAFRLQRKERFGIEISKRLFTRH